jgi:hypothetical protein
MEGNQPNQGDCVTAEVNYLDDPYKNDDGRRLHYYADFSGSTNARLKPCKVEIHNARPFAAELSLDIQGFRLENWPTKIKDFFDTEAITAPYMAECEKQIRDLTGAAYVVSAGPPHCRFDGVTDPSARYDGKPARYVHADYSQNAANMTLEYLPPELSRYSRWAIYNIWRVVTPPPQSVPLAVLDASSIRLEDEVESEVIMKPPNGEEIHVFTTLFRPSLAHRWYYFEDMNEDEVMVFKSFDSDVSKAHWVPHCAFADPSKRPGAARVSIEARVAAGFT